MDHFHAAKNLHRQLQWKKSAQHFEQVLAKEPENQKALLNIVQCYHFMGAHQKEAQVIQKLENSDIRNVDTLNKLADYYLLHGDPQVALEYYQKMEQEGTRTLEVRVGIVTCLAKLGRIDAADDYLDDIPHDTDLTWGEHLALGETYLLVHDFRSAFTNMLSAFMTADTWQARIYTLSTLFNFPLAAISTFSKPIVLTAIGLPIVFMLILAMPWKLIVFLLIEPIFVASTIKNFMMGNTKAGLFRLGYLIYLLTLLFINI